MMKRIVAVGILLLLLLGAVWIWFVSCGGVTHRELKETVEAEGAETREVVERRCEALEQKLDRIEGKLDRLLELATPRLPDGMQPAQ